MANIVLYRGGTPVFRPAFCCGDYAQFMPPFDTPHFPGTPPYDSHADGAREQGFLNLSFPFGPNLLDTTAHRWMIPPLEKLSAVGDIIQWAWVPLRGYIDSLHMELTRYDTNLDGVYVQPVAQRAKWNFTTNEWEYTESTAFANDIAQYANTTKLCLGTPAEASGSGDDATPADSPYLFARFPQTGTDLPSTFGHNLVKRDASGKPTGGLDDYFGAIVLGLKITAGAPAKIKAIAQGKFELWMCAKFLAFECNTFTG